MQLGFSIKLYISNLLSEVLERKTNSHIGRHPLRERWCGSRRENPGGPVPEEREDGSPAFGKDHRDPDIREGPAGRYAQLHPDAGWKTEHQGRGHEYA